MFDKYLTISLLLMFVWTAVAIQYKGCDTCAQWCIGEGFPYGRCDYNNKCKCDPKTADCVERNCNALCLGSRFPSGYCDDKTCKCNPKVLPNQGSNPLGVGNGEFDSNMNHVDNNPPQITAYKPDNCNEWCAQWCRDRSFPPEGCDANDNCKCGNKHN